MQYIQYLFLNKNRIGIVVILVYSLELEAIFLFLNFTTKPKCSFNIMLWYNMYVFKFLQRIKNNTKLYSEKLLQGLYPKKKNMYTLAGRNLNSCIICEVDVTCFDFVRKRIIAIIIILLNHMWKRGLNCFNNKCTSKTYIHG